MSLQTRLSALITAIGADIKALQARTPTVLGAATGPPLSTATSEPTKAVEWTYSGGGMLAKIAGVNPASTSRGELWARVTNPTGLTVADRLILGNDGSSDFLPLTVGALPTTSPSGGALFNGQECYLLVDGTTTVWHLKYSTGTTKWHYLGGPALAVGPLTQNVGGDTYNNGGYLAASNTGGTGPNITVPYAGIYDIELTAYMRHGAAGGAIYFSFQLPDGTAASDNDALQFLTAASNQDIRHSKTVRKTLTAGTLSARYKATGPSSVGLVDYREMRITPVKIG